MGASERLRLGIVGAGRSRQGLGPYYAVHAEAAGAEVVAIAGRTPDRTTATAQVLAERLGHPVRACEDVAALLGLDLDALIIASPPETHLDALRGALSAGVPVLCEKPLVTLQEHPLVPELMAEFRERGLLVMESCQWPLLLPALGRLYPDQDFQRPRQVAMRLSPVSTGSAMMQDALPHFLSVLGALVAIDADTRIAAQEFRGWGRVADGLDLRLELRRKEILLSAELLLRQCPQQPRPAWIEVDGARMERQIRLPDYQISLVAGARNVSVDDPLAALVYGFAQLAREAALDRVQSESYAIQNRARLYHQIIEALDHHLEV
jgi:hypothetical protein